MANSSNDQVFALGPRITVLPVIHGSGDFAWEVRRRMLQGNFDALAVPLPESFRIDVEQSILELPRPSVVVQEQVDRSYGGWSELNSDGDEDSEDERDEDQDDDSRAFNYVPIDPCQPVIAALRSALEEHCPRYFIDLETEFFVPYSQVFPDPFALKKVSLEAFASSLLPVLERPQELQRIQRLRYMAHRLRELAIDHPRLLFVCSILDWPWIREAYYDVESPTPEHDLVEPTAAFPVEHDSLYFMLGELPFITALYERARAELQSDDNLSIDGIKELLLAARDSYRKEFRGRARKITPNVLRLCLQYVRNLTLMNRRFSPELSTIITGTKQTAGDQYALHVLEKAKHYDVPTEPSAMAIRFGIGKAVLPDRPEEPAFMISRLPGPPTTWRNVELLPRPSDEDRRRWQHDWNPHRQCSWPPEDERIENFRATVFERAQQIAGADLAKTEKFTTSIKDGIDIRDTLRHWYEGEIYVKVMPPNRGELDAAVMLFDSPADPREYPWRTIWFAEHEQESTLAFFATNYEDNPVGPGICSAQYGGALFLFPPVTIADVWTDPRLDFAATLEERLLGAACLYARGKQIALVSALPPGPAWRQIAQDYGKQWIHVPLAQFSDGTLQQLRQVHVLNGQHIRSYAAHYIRKP